MTDSIRQTIMAAFEDRLQTILISNGYQTNLGQNIFEWRGVALEDSELPAAIYRDMQDNIALTFGREEHKLRIDLDIFAEATPDAGIMRKIIADIHISMASPDTTLGGIAEDILPISDETIQTEHENKKYFGISLKIIVQYVSKIWDPYTS
jgi:hypothetical protein